MHVFAGAGSPDCLPINKNNEIENIETFGKSTLKIFNRLPSVPVAKVKPEVKETSAFKKRRSIADIEVLIDLTSGAIESRWQNKLKSVGEKLLEAVHYKKKSISAKVKYSDRGGSACQSDYDFYACGTLSFQNTGEAEQEGRGEVCEVELLDEQGAQVSSSDLGSAQKKVFELPKEVGFPSYSMTCFKTDAEGRIIYTKRAFLDPDGNEIEVVDLLSQ